MSVTNVSITLKNSNLKELDQARDLISRSAYIDRALEEYLKKIKKSKGGRI